ncbi:response regulator [Sphingosinicella sp. YJ22]|uniref:response regulator n=1 Tax=Sphingosinicella sp. YJ22 TaxID=1104780 RepID=UPI00140B9B78|nr:response regulator [Sphingosinicella sp. YJ22]
MVFGKRERAIQCILVVEDEPLVAFDNEHLLKDAGYDVVATVDTAEEALRVIGEAEKIDLVLADLSLSGEGSGVHVAEAAHAKGIAVLFVTGACPLEAQHLAVGCLAKPYSDKVLKSALGAIDAMLRGDKVKKTPEGFTIFAKDAA